MLIERLFDRIQGKAPKGAKRHPDWSKFRKAYISEFPNCFICKRKADQLHHLIPFHLAPDMELDIENVMQMCRRCHLFVGHLNNFRSINPTCESDAREWRFRIKGE